MPKPVYDSIGAGYNIIRAADPYLVGRILTHLVAVQDGSYLDVGCGTGNYLAALSRRGFDWTGVEPSATMIAAARSRYPEAPLIQATAESLPLGDAVFDGALAMLTTHHWTEVGVGLTEIGRVLKPGARLVLFTFTPAQIRSYWLRHYFPHMIERAALGVPEWPVLLSLLRRAGCIRITTEPYLVREDLQDHFLYSHKYRPAQYLRPEVRAGSSGFRLLATPEEVAQGVARLEGDVASGRIDEVIANAVRNAGNIGDYLFVVATAGGTRT